MAPPKSTGGGDKGKSAAVATSTRQTRSMCRQTRRCKQHKSFKERANEVKEGLENAVPGIIVTLNPLKPRRGCFEIREEGGESFISLLDMKKPFTPMTELDMEEVLANIVERIKCERLLAHNQIGALQYI
ncbi:hypothetical protein F2Q69_00062690 [Brassica cretica]|uniref:Uncharacterized protein n=1 Tax=Brassica cretica TaxID=69181 RepID=A0A8S9RIG2_BRACR|nr:hypothetical protein F2Q69_00062690 [Brassica cretica]